jgi:hypothetical protein
MPEVRNDPAGRAVVWEDRFRDKIELLEAADHLGIGAPQDSGSSYWMMDETQVKEMIVCMTHWVLTRRLVADDAPTG